MNDLLINPESLSEMAARFEANGQSLEANLLRQCAMQWQRAENGEAYAYATAPAEDVIPCKIVEADFTTAEILVRVDANHPYRVCAAQYELRRVA